MTLTHPPLHRSIVAPRVASMMDGPLGAVLVWTFGLIVVPMVAVVLGVSAVLFGPFLLAWSLAHWPVAVTITVGLWLVIRLFIALNDLRRERKG